MRKYEPTGIAAAVSKATVSCALDPALLVPEVYKATEVKAADS